MAAAYLASSTRYTCCPVIELAIDGAQTHHPPDPKRMGFLTAHRARDDAVQENTFTIENRSLPAVINALPELKAGLPLRRNLWWGASQSG